MTWKVWGILVGIVIFTMFNIIKGQPLLVNSRNRPQPTFDQLIEAGIQDAEDYPERYTHPRHGRARHGG